ncbi:hypothetical protein F4604DRAFT_1959624 [Suillus subluteus]|nr:hypothetical protein F4604DRAFT_1959624 [Suillus subluteus]
MSAARAEWNKLANNIPALEERSSVKDEHLAPSDGASVAPLASTFSRTGTEVGKKSERSYVKTTPQRCCKGGHLNHRYYGLKSKNERGMDHTPQDGNKNSHRSPSGPNTFTSVAKFTFVTVASIWSHRQRSTENAVIPAIVWHIARVMTEVEKSRARYHWGTPEIRIYRNVAIPEFSLLEIILTLPLFGAHSMYRTRLQESRVTGAVYLPDFRKLMQQFLDEWVDFNLLATIFVSTNVAFLAVPVSNTTQCAPFIRLGDRCAAQNRFTFIIIIHYDEDHRRGAPRLATSRQGGRALPGRSEYHIQLHVIDGLLIRSQESDLYHVRRLGEHVDLTITACFFSLPVVSLSWYVLCVTIAIAAFYIQGTNISSTIILVTLLSLLGFFASLLFFWHIWRSPRHDEIEEDFNMDTRLNVNPPKGLSKVEMAVNNLDRVFEDAQRWAA